MVRCELNLLCKAQKIQFTFAAKRRLLTKVSLLACGSESWRICAAGANLDISALIFTTRHQYIFIMFNFDAYPRYVSCLRHQLVAISLILMPLRTEEITTRHHLLAGFNFFDASLKLPHYLHKRGIIVEIL